MPFSFICLHNLLLYILLTVLDYQALVRVRNLLTSHIVGLTILLGCGSVYRRDAGRCSRNKLNTMQSNVCTRFFITLFNTSEYYCIFLSSIQFKRCNCSNIRLRRSTNLNSCTTIIWSSNYIQISSISRTCCCTISSKTYQPLYINS